MRQNEVDLVEAARRLDVSVEVLGTLARERNLKLRLADGTIYFLRKDIEELVDLHVEEERSKAAS
jgi:hypothetical protein